MAKMIDISNKITNELPMIKIADDFVITVNNRHKNVINLKAMIEELERKTKQRAAEDPEAEGFDEFALMDKVMQMLLSPSDANRIREMDLPIPEYRALYEAIMSTISDQDDETPSGQ